MDNIYIKSVQAVQKIMINDKHCFELYPLSITDYSTQVEILLRSWKIL